MDSPTDAKGTEPDGTDRTGGEEFNPPNADIEIGDQILNRRGTEQPMSFRRRSSAHQQQPLGSGRGSNPEEPSEYGDGDDSAKMKARRFSEVQLKRQSTQQSAGSTKRMLSLNSTGKDGLKISSKHSQQQDDSLS